MIVRQETHEGQLVSIRLTAATPGDEKVLRGIVDLYRLGARIEAKYDDGSVFVWRQAPGLDKTQ